MILPNVDVVSAFYESYVTIRKEKWKLDENEPTQMLTSAKAMQKVKICIELLDRFQKAKTFDDWVDIIYLCALKEHNENLESSGNLFFGLAKYFLDKPLLLLTIHASLAYIISQLSLNKEYTKLLSNLDNEKLELENAIREDIHYGAGKDILDKKKQQLTEIIEKIYALSTAKNYHESYFQDIIIVREPKALDLEEKNFADFERNVLKGARKLTLCNKLLGYKANSQQIAIKEEIVKETPAEVKEEEKSTSHVQAIVDGINPESKPIDNEQTIKSSNLRKHSTFKPQREHYAFSHSENDVRKYNLRRNH